MNTVGVDESVKSGDDRRDMLLNADPATRRDLLRAYVRQLCSEVLPEWSPDTPDDEALFFESIAAAEFKAVIERDLDVAVPFTDLVEEPTVASLADLFARGLDAAAPGTSRLVEPDVSGRFEAFGLTDVQHAYWLGRSGLFELGGVSAHLYVEFESAGFDVARASWAFRCLVDRHDMLRAVVRADGRQQVLESVPDFEVEFEDLSGLPESAAWERVASVRQRLSHEVRPADVWPLFGVVAQVLPGGRWRVHVSFDLLVADAGSIQLLLDEWVRLYAEPDVVLAPVGLSFRDYVGALSRLEGSAAALRARDYWLGRLGSLPPAPELPLVAGGNAGGRFVRREFVLDRARWRALRSAAVAAGVTPSVLVAAAYAEVLAAWSKSRWFTVNVTVGDRLPVHPDVSRVVGDFTSLVLLEVDFRESRGFVERVRGLQRQLWRDLEHRAFGGVRVLRELARVHGVGRAVMPVVFTSVVGREFGGEGGELPGLGRVVSMVSQTPQVLLDHQIYERADGLVVSWDAVEERFPAGLLDAAFGEYERLLHRLGDDPDCWHHDRLVRAPEEHLHLTTPPAGDDVPDGLLQQAVTAYADAHPHRTAVVSTGRTLTYGELLSRSRRVARRLAEWGVARGDLVAICMDKGWEQVVGVLGVLDAAAGYVPIDAGWPQQRIADVCQQTRAGVVLTQRAVAGRTDWPSGVRVAAVDDDEVWAGVDDAPVPVAGEPTDVAYVIFTSGSTGRPKGVVIDHRGALNTVVDVNRRFEVGPGDRVLAVSSLSFDLSVWDIFGPLSVGGAVVLPDPGTSRDPEHWARLVAEERVSIWNSVPALFELFVQYVADRPRDRDLPIRLALLSGDWIPLSLPDRARQVLPGLKPVSLGGATEGSIWSIFYPIEEVDPAWTSIPYGRPLTNQNVLVLDEQLEPRPVWAVGELYIGGAGVAKGYWGDPERTAERFITHPRTGAYLYRTGDLGRLLPDGTIEFLGREDFQVKVGGFRIELGEIETVILSHPAVAAATVTTIGDPRGTKRLAAYVVAEPSAASVPGGDEIKELCQQKLPAYMVPATVTALPELPLTPNGKVNRAALPAPHARRAHTPPATPVEQILAEIWADLLGAETVSTTDNLFELGADSLLALRAVAAVDARGLRLQIRDVFANPTIVAQATAVGAVGADELPRVEPDVSGRFEGFGLTDVQHAYWLGRSGLFELGGVSAHLYVEFESADFDAARASAAFRCLVDRHDMLRAVVRGDGRQQVLESLPDFEVEFEDLSGLPEEVVGERVAAVRERLSHEVRPADVWPLFGVVAQVLPGGRWRVHVSFDLLVADAGSIQVLLDEWVRRYAEPGLELAPVGLTFRDYMRALSQLESSAAFGRARDYWLGRLGSLPPAPELPLVAGGDGGNRFVRREFALDRGRWRALRSAAVAAGVTPSVLVAAAYAEVLAAWSKSRWFTVNVTVGDRLPVHPDVSRVVGDFTSLVLLEVDFRESRGFVERVRGLQRQLWRDLEHRAFGGVRVLRELARVHGVGRAVMPVVFTSVVGREFGGEGGELPGLGRVVSMVSQTPQVLLDHQIYERADGLVVSWDAVEERFPAGLLDAAFGEYERLLHRLADDPNCWTLPRLIEADDEHDATLSAHQGQERQALPARIAPAERVHTPPATPTERILADIWANLLGLEDVSTTDNLFELGADSLLALRAVADADGRGLKIDLREVFAHPTVRGQANRARAVASETGPAAVAGPSALTPSQLWFLQQDLPERHHWNDASFLLSLRRPLDLDLLRRSLRQILDHHDALRLRFTSSTGTWAGTIAAPEPAADLPFSVHNFATLTGPQQKKAVTEVSDALQRSLDLADGPLIRVAYFDLGQRPHCLLLLAHWLVVDHFSSRVLLEDLLACYRQYGTGAAAATLPGRTTPFPVWAAALAERARSPELVGQLPYWTDPVRRELSPLHLDGAGPNTLESLQTITLRLEHDVTEAVLRSVPRAFGTNIAAVLCTALVRSLPLPAAGERRVLIDLERHGRDLGLPGLDISRTVGRFSTIAPIMLELDHRADVAESLATIGRQLAAVPDQGHGYGLLRYLSEHGEQLRQMPPAQAGLNYVGQVDELFLRSDLLSVPRMSYGAQRSSTGTRFRSLDVLGYVMGRRLSFTIGYSTNLHSPATAESFAADFRSELERLVERAEES
ncbi:non-ribosomal peptide synthase domain TIGR01720/amino acid adenylation domain-containing protein [Micromonospora viridifaciens]|uniref:Phenyloxazoline synthase MbtB n=1 Tax=Micromonospora viridifaciens TaxID=1881 RepID=A0A1C4WU89_MICVI|nr:non-ribosomal peptide synthetase [Micromonospora viridifaciens]SCE99441.1 non-ribosomal peptide synthase domain TIGR01720/amino acid adenylation domain-containing protein [Micromonospora viridifaciens]